MLWLLVLSACAGPELAPAGSRPTDEKALVSELLPLRQMAEDGRDHPTQGRACLLPDSTPLSVGDPDGLALHWLSWSEVLRLLLSTLPPLVEAAEGDRLVEQRDSPIRVLRVSDILTNQEAGGLIALSRRKRRERLVRERLDAEDLWRKYPRTRSYAYFDGRIEYGATDLPGFPVEKSRVVGWAQSYRPNLQGVYFGLPAQVHWTLTRQGETRLRLEGNMSGPCFERVRIEGSLELRGFSDDCKNWAAGSVERIRFIQGKDSVTLMQDDHPCDACVLRASEDEPSASFCPTLWQIPHAAGDPTAWRVAP